ncbi:MAG: sodium:solute symporter family protein, partial [Sutterellaceae bacterium]|nr:sodium:solute symporter family protein [Sutterellaceae bacterium]
GLGIWAAPIILGMYWKKTTKAGVFTAVILGEIFYILLLTQLKSWSFGFNPLIVAFAVTMVILIVVSLFTKPVSEATVRRHFDDLDRPVAK